MDKHSRLLGLFVSGKDHWPLSAKVFIAKKARVFVAANHFMASLIILSKSRNLYSKSSNLYSKSRNLYSKSRNLYS
jgi:hypothetical protein